MGDAIEAPEGRRPSDPDPLQRECEAIGCGFEVGSFEWFKWLRVTPCPSDDGCDAWFVVEPQQYTRISGYTLLDPADAVFLIEQHLRAMALAGDMVSFWRVASELNTAQVRALRAVPDGCDDWFALTPPSR